jgi:hypothetical protein
VSESPFSTVWIAVIVSVIIILPTLVAPLGAWLESKLRERQQTR